MNTPDTECEGCKHNKKYPNEDVTHTCPSTPDTEEAEKVAMRLYVDLKKLEAENFPPEEKVAVYKAIVSNLLTSRDTYWKERVEAEIADAVELTKREIKHRVERYFKDAYLSLKQQGGVHIHLEEIQEIIDDSTPPGFAPTPLQDK